MEKIFKSKEQRGPISYLCLFGITLIKEYEVRAYNNLLDNGLAHRAT